MDIGTVHPNPQLYTLQLSLLAGQEILQYNASKHHTDAFLLLQKVITWQLLHLSFWGHRCEYLPVHCRYLIQNRKWYVGDEDNMLPDAVWIVRVKQLFC